MKLKFGFAVLLTVLFAGLTAHAEDVSGARTHFNINQAKTAAVQFFRSNPAYGVKPDEKVRFQKSNSEENTIESLNFEIKMIQNPGNVGSILDQNMVNELTADPSLQIFTIFLATGEGDSRTQTILLVKLKIAEGKDVAEVLDFNDVSDAIRKKL